MSGQLPLLSDRRHEFKPARKSTLLNNYDPTAYPPDLSFAAQHGLSQRVGHRIPMLKDVQRCRCCLEPIHKEQLSLFCDVGELCHCGESTPLYFVFVKQCILLLLFNAVILMIPSTLINYTMGKECKDINGTASGFFEGICQGSIINVMNVQQLDALQIQAVLNFMAILANIVLIAYFQLKMEEYVVQLTAHVNASDYSFVIKGLPADINISQIQKYVEDKLLYSGAPDLTITKIYLIYNFKDYLLVLQAKQAEIERLIKLKQELTNVENKNLKSSNYQQKLELQKKQTQLNQKIGATENKIQQTEIDITKFEGLTNQLTIKLRNEGVLETATNKNVLNFSGKAIVTVNDPRSKDIILESWDSRTYCQRFAYGLSQLLESKKSKIVLSAAPDPADIIFANMGAKKKAIWKSRIFYSLLIVVLLLLDFLIVALCKKFLKEEKAIQQGNIIFSFLNSIMVSLFCSLFRNIIRTSQRQSCYNTYSKLSYQSVAKLVLIFQINMLFTTFVANVASFYLVREDRPTFQGFPLNLQSFLFDIFFLIATNPIFSLVLVILDHRHFRNLIKRYRIKQGSIAVSQAEANLSFENIHFDVCHKYGTIYRFLIFTAGIACVFPLSILICLLALSCLYCLDKYLLLRRYSVTIKITTRFTILVQKIMSQFPIYLSLTNFIIMFIPIQDGRAFQQQKYSKAYYYISVIGLALSFLNYLFGNTWLKRLLKMVVNKKLLQEESPPIFYKDIENSLENDYSHNYPYFRVSKKISREEGNQTVRKDKLKELRDNQKLGIFEVIKFSMHHNRYAQ